MFALLDKSTEEKTLQEKSIVRKMELRFIIILGIIDFLLVDLELRYLKYKKKINYNKFIIVHL